MTVAAFNTYAGKIERGTSSLSQIDAAERGKLVTADEARRLRDYWHAIYDVAGLSVEVVAGRAQVVTWTAPTLAVGPLVEVHRVGVEHTVSVVPRDGRAVFAGDVGDDEIVIGFDVSVVAANGYRGATASASVTVPAVPTPDPIPTPDPPADPATGDASTPEQTPAADAAAAEPDPAGA